MSSPVSVPVEVDTELARLHGNRTQVSHQVQLYAQGALIQAGAEWYYRGRQRVTDMLLRDAEEILAADIAAHAATGDHGYALVRGGSNIGSIRRTVAGLAECRGELARVADAMEALEERYTGWSRFFLVTSSQGHIHRSMHCSTCRPTTGYGWLPEMSGRTDADCVAEHGPALCSVCFPSAPVEWMSGMVTKARAVKAAA